MLHNACCQWDGLSPMLVSRWETPSLMVVSSALVHLSLLVTAEMSLLQYRSLRRISLSMWEYHRLQWIIFRSLPVREACSNVGLSWEQVLFCGNTIGFGTSRRQGCQWESVPHVSRKRKRLPGDRIQILSRVGNTRHNNQSRNKNGTNKRLQRFRKIDYRNIHTARQENKLHVKHMARRVESCVL
jgi:hypothetical protein